MSIDHIRRRRNANSYIIRLKTPKLENILSDDIENVLSDDTLISTSSNCKSNYIKPEDLIKSYTFKDMKTDVLNKKIKRMVIDENYNPDAWKYPKEPNITFFLVKLKSGHAEVRARLGKTPITIFVAGPFNIQHSL